MELAELNQDERTALVALLKQIVLSAGHMTKDESDEIAAVAEEFGEESYQGALDAAELKLSDEAALKAALRAVSREDAREVMFETALEAAMPGAIDGYESELLSWLGKEWKIEVTFPDQDENSG